MTIVSPSDMIGEPYLAAMVLPEEKMRDKLICMFPNFQVQWEDEDNCWKNEDGSFNLWGLFSEFSRYTRDHFNEISEQKRQTLMSFIESCVSDKDGYQDDLNNAVCTCFLENLAGEPPLSGQLRRYMGPKSRAFFDYWDVSATAEEVSR